MSARVSKPNKNLSKFQQRREQAKTFGAFANSKGSVVRDQNGRSIKNTYRGPERKRGREEDGDQSK